MVLGSLLQFSIVDAVNSCVEAYHLFCNLERLLDFVDNSKQLINRFVFKLSKNSLSRYPKKSLGTSIEENKNYAL